MSSRNVFIDSINHKDPGRITVDFGATAVTGIHVTCVAQLREYYGLEKLPVKVHEPFQMLGYIDEDLKQAIGVDVEGVYPLNTMFGFPNKNWKEYKLDNNLVVLVPEGFVTTKDSKNNTYIYPEGDKTVDPSGKMPSGGHFFDAIIRQETFDEEELDPQNNCEEFKVFDDETIEYFKQSTKKAREKNRGVIANIGGTAIGDIALVPGPFLKHPKGIRDIEEWYMSTAMRQDYLKSIFEYQTDIALENMEKVYKATGDRIDAIFLCGTDFGTQQGTFCSKETYSNLYMPYYKKMNEWIHENTGWKTFKHSCGAVESMMELFIESGFDIINPLQFSAKGMDPEKIKSKYGDKLTFWGGGVDTQKTLPFGTPEQVRDEVLKRCEILSRNGGFVFNAIHNVQAKTPVENIVAMIDAVKEFNSH